MILGGGLPGRHSKHNGALKFRVHRNVSSGQKQFRMQPYIKPS